MTLNYIINDLHKLFSRQKGELLAIIADLNMTPEFQQPNIPKPDLENPRMWAQLPAIRSEWIRHISPQININADKQNLGEALSHIIGDDENCFAWENKANYSEKSANISMSDLSLRLEHEIQTPGMPGEISKRLGDFRKLADTGTWENREKFRKAKERWLKLKKWVIKKIDDNDLLESAIIYSRVNQPTLSTYWWKFLYGEKGLD